MPTHHRDGGKQMIPKGKPTTGQALSADRKRAAQANNIARAEAAGMTLAEYQRAQQLQSRNLETGWTVIAKNQPVYRSSRSWW
jgi:phage protein D